MGNYSKSYRPLAKAISWESISIFVSLLIIFLLTGNLEVTLELVIVCHIIRILIFYFHEQIWHRTE